MRLRNVVLVGLGWAASVTASQPKCDLLPKPPNVIATPSYARGENCPGTPEDDKVQYDPLTSDLPLFSVVNSDAELTNGAFYDEGSELYINPEPPFQPTGESINDQEAEPPAGEPQR